MRCIQVIMINPKSSRNDIIKLLKLYDIPDLKDHVKKKKLQKILESA